MTDFVAGAGQYVTYREHIAAKEEAQKRQAALEMEVATLRAALMHVPEDLRKLTEAVQSLGSKLTTPASADNQTLLAIQRTLDVLSKQPQPQPTPVSELVKLLNTPPPGAGWKTGLGYGALLAVIVIMAWKLFLPG